MTGRIDRSGRFGDRGQLLLIAAILMAVVIVGTVVLLNGIRFTDEAGSTDPLRETKQIDQTVSELRPALQTVLVGVGNDSGPFVANDSAGMDALRANVSVFGTTYGNLSGYGTGALVSVSLNESRTINGTVAGQASGSLENDAGATDWTIAENLGPDRDADLAYLGLVVTDQSADATANFTLRYRNDVTPSERLDLIFNGTTVFVNRSSAPAPDRLCASDHIGGNTTEVTVSGGSISLAGNGTDTCDVVELDAGSATEYSLRILNGDQATGSFVATVGASATVPSGTPVVESSAVVNPAVRIEYDSPTAQFETTVTALEGNVEP